MFGMALDKFILVIVVASLILGPQRLPLYAHKLSTLVRNFRDFTQATKTRAESELGVPLNTEEWGSQLQQYDPRRIIREALTRDDRPGPADKKSDGGDATTVGSEPEVAGTPAIATPDLAGDDTDSASPAGEPERWIVVGGSSGHPVRRRVLAPPVDAAASDDP